jgi:hypothetical protein
LILAQRGGPIFPLLPGNGRKRENMSKETIEQNVEYALTLTAGHKCRVDRRKPAGGGVCDVCQARFVLQDIKRQAASVDKLVEAAMKVTDTIYHCDGRPAARHMADLRAALALARGN